LDNACYYSVQNLLSSHLLSKNIEIRIYRTTILSVVLYGCEIGSLTLREEHRLRMFENRVLRRMLGPKMGCLIFKPLYDPPELQIVTSLSHISYILFHF
jgi:hypothetical protein